jgi:hypothetical protein
MGRTCLADRRIRSIFKPLRDFESFIKVTVRPMKARTRINGRPKANGKRSRSTLAERLASVIGKAKHLPVDTSVNLDHYLYGLLKRK